MAKPRKDERRIDILSSAARLFRKQGYNATSYQSIADELHESRALIQHYFPQKSDFALIFFDLLGTCTTKLLDRKNLLTGSELIDFYLIGQLYFSYLAQNEATKRLVVDILSDRNLSDEVLFLSSQWVEGFLPGESEEENQWNLERILLRGGGILTYIHYCLSHEKPMTIEPFVKENFIERMLHRGITRNNACAELNPHKIDDSTMASLLHDLDDIISLELNERVWSIEDLEHLRPEPHHFGKTPYIETNARYA